ncbi:type IV pili methyl-accepting chemotaxis transducer N-terminal domain-containing protein [uncultured Roseobacter sp.]|uniref:type IV pili methyl-accepting chemotaxis transducer N-terminal domain-containing protein n=1 Tax=uncultured Roseobacter sp. TaxID=114847 RepID=UPI00261DB7CE|nr:type IV pili methyl-accepting chemotaxis transducer N-terminal domain-containing protein [uncultured Roseobacter sp.]
MLHADETAQVSEETNARNRVDNAGRQRMLTQRLAKNACFVMAGIEPDTYAAHTDETFHRFNQVLLAIREGDPELGMLPEIHQDVLDNLSEVETLWAELGPAARQIAAGDLHSVPMQQLIQLNIETLKRMHATVLQMGTHYANENVSPEMVTTLATAGRQRMLSQKLSKELCFRTIGLEREGSVELIEETIAQFDAAMAKLLAGAPQDGILPPPLEDVRSLLEKTNTTWAEFKALARRIEENPDIGPDERLQIAELGNLVLQEMESAVQSYLQ